MFAGIAGRVVATLVTRNFSNTSNTCNTINTINTINTGNTNRSSHLGIHKQTYACWGSVQIIKGLGLNRFGWVD